MVLKRSSRGVFGRLVFWILFVSATAIIIFNMVFVLQTATELAILKSAGQDKTTFPAFSDEKISRTQDKVPVKPTTEGKIFNFIYNCYCPSMKIMSVLTLSQLET